MSLVIRLLGQIKICRAEQPVSGRGAKPVALLAYLLVTGKAQPRRHLIDLLFDGPADPKASLRWTLAELRQVIGPGYLLADRQQVAFNFEKDHWVDVAAFEAGQLDLYRGDFLAGLNVRNAPSFEQWALIERERLRGIYQEALTRQLETVESRGDDQAVIETARQLLDLDNLGEGWHRALMRAYARQGQREAALAQFDLCRQILQTELGVEPAAETVTLAKAIRQGQVRTTTADSPGSERSLPVHSATPRHNLPPQSTPFIGREEELAEITRRLTNPACRLLTLVGPGGIGKTRLALAAAECLLPGETFPGGIYFVPLAALSSVDFLVSALADRLNFFFQGGADPKVQLLNVLGELKQATLLVLDNFEQLGEGTGLLAAILQSAPVVKLLVTSRERLNLRDEWLLDIRGLPFPEPSPQPSPSEGEGWVGVEGYSAVQLFLQTAARLKVTLALSEVDKPFVARICQLVEGMPLGLELAAAWVRVLSCHEIATEIEKSLGFLTTSLRDVPARHRSLMAVFDHSWRILSPVEQRVFRNLAVFRGGFSREAAEQVAGASLPLLAALVDKSMLRRNDSGRYELHELLRQYGYTKLDEAGETDQVRSRHLAFFLELAEEAEPKLQGVEQARWIEKLDIETGNLRAALAWSLEGGNAQTGLRLAATLGQFWFMRSQGYDEGIRWLERVLPETDPSEQTEERAKAFHWLGQFAHYQSDDFTATAAFEKSLALYRALGDKTGIADSLLFLGDIASFQGDDITARSLYAEARSAYEESLVILRERGDTWTMARSLNYLGEIARVEGDYAAARSFYEESLASRRKLADQRGMAVSLYNLGQVAHHQGDVRQAATYFKESLTMSQELRDKRGVADGLVGLAGVAGNTGQLERAARLFGAAETLYEDSVIRLEYSDQVEYDRNVAIVRTQLDEATFAAAWTAGRAMMLEQAVDYALAVQLGGNTSCP